jgi:transposase
VALPTLPDPAAVVTLGVDTHAETHIAAALDPAGRLLATHTIPTTPAGYAALLAWASTLGSVDRVGVEGTGSYGAGLARWLRAHAPGRRRGRPARPGRPTAPGQGRRLGRPRAPPEPCRPARPPPPRPPTARWR